VIALTSYKAVLPWQAQHARQRLQLQLMHVRAMSMRMGLAFCLAVAVRVAVVVTVGMNGFLCLRRAVTAKVVVVAMRRRRNHGLRNPALFADFRLFGHLVIVLVAPSLRVSGEPS
jgi:hypothetical protein